LAGLRSGVDWGKPDELADLAQTLNIEVDQRGISLDGEDVTETVRSLEVTAVTRHAADNPRVREQLVRLQRDLAGRHDVVTEGRDQGTVVFPDAACKIFLTATPEERARRRLEDLKRQAEPATLEEVLGDQQRRDTEDANRPVGPLVRAADAIEVMTDGMTLEQVVDHLEDLVRQKAPRTTS